MLSSTLGLGIFVIYFNIASGDILVLPYEGRFIEAEIYDEPALFGNGLPYEGLHGMILAADPPNGCNAMAPAPQFDDNRTGRWILLMARYNCSFEAKVRNAQQANYDAVIVHNLGSDALERMSATNSTGIHIPSVFIGASDGFNIREIYANNSDYFVIINSETRVNWNKLLIPFLIVVGICFLVMVIFMVIKFMRDRRRQRRERLSSSALNKIPTHKFQKGDPYETCAICLDDYVDGEKLRVLPCAHAYHSKCIDPWLTKNRRVCPVCKRRVFASDETPYSDSENDTDTDDTTPLLTGGVRGTQGGTFRRSILFDLYAQSRSGDSAANVNLASDRHSINGEHGEHAEVEDPHSDGYSTDTTSTSTSDDAEVDADETRTVTRPAASTNEELEEGHEVVV